MRKHFQYVLSHGLLRGTAQRYESFLQTALKLWSIASKYWRGCDMVPCVLGCLKCRKWHITADAGQRLSCFSLWGNASVSRSPLQSSTYLSIYYVVFSWDISPSGRHSTNRPLPTAYSYLFIYSFIQPPILQMQLFTYTRNLFNINLLHKLTITDRMNIWVFCFFTSKCSLTAAIPAIQCRCGRRSAFFGL